MRVLPLVALCFVPPTLSAWGPEGHSLVSRLALTELTPQAQARVAEILGPGRTLVSVASWADQVRNARPESANWHFVDIPISAARLVADRDCRGGDCVTAKIEDFRRVLADSSAPPDRRREALMYLVHFIGDLHEPLHSADNDDRGGNEVRLIFHNRQTNLHSLWDSGLLNRMAPADELFPELEAMARKHGAQWRKGTVADWAGQSHKTARKVTYGKLPKARGSAPVTVPPDYERQAAPAVKEQLAKAGVRLAAVLNETLQ